MNYKKPTTITAWSFSRYSVHKQCPFKAKLKFVDKIEEPSNEAMARGSHIHGLAEDYIKGKIKALPKELSQFKDEFMMLRKQYKKSINGMSVEETWAFTKDWDETQWNDWVKCWVRIKLDCAHHYSDDALIVTDFKTGRYRPENQEEYIEQLELYALGAFLTHEHIETVYPRLMYLDHGVVYPEEFSEDEDNLTFTREDLPDLIKLWNGRVKAMMNDKTFPPKPNDKCHWCHFRNSNKANGGGQCRY